MSRVLLVNMPFYNTRWPNLGLGLLQAAVQRRGIACDTAYFNFDLAERTGLDHYTWIADQFAFVLGGERLFAKHYYAGTPEGEAIADDDAYGRDVLVPVDPRLTGDDRRDYQETLAHVGPFLDACMAAVDWSRYAVVGFSTSFQQTLASLCLARRVKQMRPDRTIVFGGAACAAEMGVELLRQFSEIDYVFLGEADEAFPLLVEQILAGGPVALPAGVAARADEGRGAKGEGRQWPSRPSPFAPRPSAFSSRPSPLALRPSDLNGLPNPNFDDYFARLERSPLKSQIEPMLFFETSRGCWWGEKRHCAFCGLNGAELAFRSKTPQRAVDELRHLVERYGVNRAATADNILDRDYFATLLPMLRDARLGVRFEYEMKTNLTRPQVQLLVDAGLGAAQLGIETFSTLLLRLIGKGATAMQNLQALKWFTASGVEVKWNLLYGFPGEDPAEYESLAGLLPALYHLAPPIGIGRVRLDRFSPYFADPAGHGMARPRPHRAFRHVYPFAADVLEQLAYYWEYDYADGRQPLDYAAPVVAAAEVWQELKGSVTLRGWDRDDGVLILTDTRPGAAALQRRLAGLEREVYLFCDTARTWAEIASLGDEAALRRMLGDWLAAQIMVSLDERYLSLALRPLAV